MTVPPPYCFRCIRCLTFQLHGQLHGPTTASNTVIDASNGAAHAANAIPRCAMYYIRCHPLSFRPCRSIATVATTFTVDATVGCRRPSPPWLALDPLQPLLPLSTSLPLLLPQTQTPAAFISTAKPPSQLITPPLLALLQLPQITF